MNVVGDVGGKIAIMVDDLIDDVQSFVDAAVVLKVCVVINLVTEGGEQLR